LEENEDSSIFYSQKALRHAERSRDTALLITSWHNLSLHFSSYGHIDSAMVYARKTIQYSTSKLKGYSKYYFNIGNIYADKCNKDSAIYFLNKCLTSSNTAASAYQVLSELENKSKHYQTAYLYQNKYVVQLDSFINKQGTTEIQHLVYKHQTEMKVKEEQNRYKRVIGYCIFLFITIGFIIILYYQNKVNRKKRKEALYRQSIEHSYEKINAMQQRIDENEKFINVLQFEQNKNAKEINERETLIEQLKEEKFKLQTWLFEQTPIYKRITELSHQNVSQKRERKVLTSEESEKLKKTIFEIHNQSIYLLKTSYPRLTDDDILLICLQKIGFDSQTISLCFGYSDTTAINQRKSRMKGKMSQQENLKS